MLLPEIPFPANTGGRIVVMKRIEYLSKKHHIYLFSIIDNEMEYKYEQNLYPYCKEVHLYNRNEHKIQNIIKSFFGKPYACVSRTNPKMKKNIEICFEQNKPDVVLVEFPQMLDNISNKIMKSGKVILEQHNIEFLTLMNLGKAKRLLYRMVFWVEAKFMEHYESRYYSKDLIKAYSFVSIKDKFFFEERFNKSNTFLAPVGTEIYDFHVNNGSTANIMYFGKMCYTANVDGALWFANNIFPKVKEQIPNAKFYIVGKEPADVLVKLSKRDSNIIVTGTVESVEPYYDKANLIVIPLSFGGGVKVKLLEALGHGNLVLTTSKGLEGTIFKEGIDVIAEDSIDNFSATCIDVLRNHESYNNIAINGYNKVKENYSWKAIVEKFILDIKDIIKYN